MGQEDPLEEGMATYSSILAQRIPWTEESGGLRSIGHEELGMIEATQHAYIGNMCYILNRSEEIGKASQGKWVLSWDFADW